MEIYSRNKNHYYESHSTNLNEVLKTEDFPIVARISKTNEIAGKGVIENKEILFQRRLKTKYASVRILELNDKEKVEEKKGIDFIMEHDNFVDEEYLIPTKYNGTLKFVHRPGSRKRYASVLQVLQELPRFVIVEEDTVAIPPDGIGKNVIVPAKTIFEVVRKFTADGITYLECSDGHAIYAFSETDRVNLSEVEDKKFYHLFELVRMKLLPRVFQFLDVDPTDIVLMNEELNSGLLTMAWGPMELTQFVDVDIIVGWMRDNESKTYKTCIIPSSLWPMIQLQKRAFPDQKGKDTYIERKYRHCIHTEFVERALYVISKDQSEITWIGSPDFYERNYSGSSLFDVAHIDFQDSSEDDSKDCGEYIGIFDCPPPVPDRPAKLLEPQVPTLLLPKVKEKMSVFDRVHKELINWFTPNSMQARNERRILKDDNSDIPSQKKVTHASASDNTTRCSSDSGVRNNPSAGHYKKQQHCSQPALSKTKFRSIESVTEETTQYLHPVESSARLVKSEENVRRVLPTPSDLSVSSCCSQTTSGASSDSDECDSDSSRDYDYPDFEVFVDPPPDALQHKSTRNSNLVPVDVHSTMLDTPDDEIRERSGTSFLKEHSARGEDFTLSVSPQAKQIKSSHPLESKKTTDENDTSGSRSLSYNILETNQTEDNFYQYSVDETLKCFRHCGLGELADECFNNRLDGSFFRNFDLQELKGDPFHLSNFNVLKVRKIIFEGWRPCIKNHRL